MATLYLSEQQSIVKKRDGYLIVQYPGPDKHKIEVPLIKVSQVVVSGDVTLTTPAVHTLLEAGIEICYLSMYGHFRGRLSPPVAKNALLRREQYRAYADPQRALKVAQACIKGKLENMRTLPRNIGQIAHRPSQALAIVNIFVYAISRRFRSAL